MSAHTNEQPMKEFSWRPEGPLDWGWAALVVVASIAALYIFAPMMNRYEVGILIGTAAILMAFGWYWRSFAAYSIAVALLSTIGVLLYGGDLDRGETSFFLQYLLSSQSAVVWMSSLYILATLSYFAGLLSRSEFAERVGTALTWIGSVMGMVALFVRWRESHMLGPDMGYVPVSNLYEVFIQFAVVTALIYLFYEQRFRTRALGGFVLLAITAGVIFLLWYGASREAYEIQPLIPALQSWWMKIHVPTNFIGYGAFAIAAMTAVAYLIAEPKRRNGTEGPVVSRLPSLEAMDDVMYKSIALGFVFFTIATILGAMWAAEAWGGYWTWDPKETWSLILWLNYAAWLHMRLTKGWRGTVLAWWAIVGFFVMLFTFLGVNMFLSGLHSYGEL